MSDVPTRLLRETLAGGAAQPPVSDCLDAETLAAWSDGRLSAHERTAVESHASSCARCQALVAAMARTAPPPQRRVWLRGYSVGWLVPIAAASIAVIVWIATPRPALAPGGTRPSATVTVTPSSAQLDASPRTAEPTAPPMSESRRQASAGVKRGGAPAAGAVPRRLQDEQTTTASDAAPPAPVAAPPPPPPAPSLADAAPQAAAARSQAALGGALDRQPFSGRRAESFAAKTIAAAQIVSPDPNSRWRIAPGDGVERSTDGGATWQPQSIGVAATPTAGAAPAPSICWLVGPGGLVLLSTDGRTWTRASPPDAIDLTSVRAFDAANATVTAADGRAFATSDGGRTWRRID